MPLIKFTNKTENGFLRSRIFYSPTPYLNFPIEGFGDYVHSCQFKYEYKHPSIPPQLIYKDGIKFIYPLMIKVLPETELEDIDWIKE